MGKYLLYGLGEILLIIIGILIAVNIGDRQTQKQNNITRCQYLHELEFAIGLDKKDVLDNIEAFEIWNPMIAEVLEGLNDKSLSDVDSLSTKLAAIAEFVTFLQQSKSKIEELKYADINLLTNRELKNELLFYQDTKITFLLEHQRRFNQHNDKVEDFFLNERTISVSTLEEDKYFYRLTLKKLQKHQYMLYTYEELLQVIVDLEDQIQAELNLNCEE